MRRIVPALALMGLIAVTAAAQGRSDSQGIPPGHLPPAGECRVWYDGRPPGHQPAPTSCREAEQIAVRDPGARVIYGVGRVADRDRPRAVPRTIPRRVPASPYPDGRVAYGDVAFNNGYRDGYDKGREDSRDRDRYDPGRHNRFRSADHGYDRRYGSKSEYQRVYRDGFRVGYDDAYRDNDGMLRNRRWSQMRLPWPF